MRTTILKVALPVLVVIASVIGAWAIIRARPEPEMRVADAVPALVRVVEVETETVRLTVSSQGTVSPRTETALVPEVSGRVVRVAPSLVAGGFFEEGETLLELDPTDYETALVSARAEVARARVRLAREQAEAEVARREWRELRGDEPPSLLANRELQVAEARAAVEAAEAAEERARLDLERTRIRAPYAGRVREESVDLGQFVTRGQYLGRIYSVDFAEIRLPLPDGDLAYLDLPLDYRGEARRRTGPRVILRSSFAGRRHEWEGRIVRTEGEIDPSSRMVHVVAEVEDPYARTGPSDRPPLAVGMFVEAEILGREVDGVVVLPRAVLRGSGRVLVVDSEDRLRYRDVEVLRTTREQVLVRSGLSPGERVCVSGIAAVADGMRVRPYDDEEPPA